MEIPPEGLETGGGNDLSVVVTVDESFMYIRTDSLRYHRERNIQKNSDGPLFLRRVLI
jgi:hypothetical protein